MIRAIQVHHELSPRFVSHDIDPGGPKISTPMKIMTHSIDRVAVLALQARLIMVGDEPTGPAERPINLLPVTRTEDHSDFVTKKSRSFKWPITLILSFFLVSLSQLL